MNSKNRFDKFDEQARKTLSFAQVMAQRFSHNYIGTEHLLLGLLEVPDSMAVLMLASMGVKPQKLREAVEFIIGRGDRLVISEIGLTPRAKKVIELAVDESRQMKSGYIGTEHMLLGLIREGEGLAAGVLESLGVTLAKAHHYAYLALEVHGSAQEESVTEADQSDQAGAILKTARVEEESIPTATDIVSASGQYDVFTGRARKVLSFAQEESSRLSHSYVGTEHLLLGLLDVPDGVAMQVLEQLNVDLSKVRSAVEFVINRSDRKTTGGEIGMTPRTKKVLELARDEARRMNLPYVGTEHILLGLIREGEGIAAGVLASFGVNFGNARSHTIALLGIRDLSQGTGGSSVKGFDVSSYHTDLLSSQRTEGTQTAGPSRAGRSNIPFDRFTQRARRALALAQEEAQRLQHNYIGTEHLLLALVRQQDGVASQVFKNLGVKLDKVRTTVEFIIGRGDHIVLGEIQTTPRMKRVLELAVDEARRLQHPAIDTEHLLLGLVREGEGIAIGALESLEVERERVREETIKEIKDKE